MRASIVAFAFAAFAAVEAGGVSSAISPKSSPPAGCSENYRGSFQIAAVNVTQTSKRSLEKRQDHNVLSIKLSGGILTDTEGRTGYVASNGQFQFDDPPQAGAIYTAGFSVCGNGHLALGGKQTWEKCLSGAGPTNNGEFYNLYYQNGGGQCIAAYILAEPYGAGSGPIPASVTPSTTAGSSTSMSSTSMASSTTMSTSSMAANSSSTLPVIPGHHTTKNGTATMSSMSASGSTTMTSKHTGAGGVTKHTTVTKGQMSTSVTTPGGATATTKTAGTAAGASASSSSSAAGNAAPTMGLSGEVFGIAAGMLAYAML